MSSGGWVSDGVMDLTGCLASDFIDLQSDETKLQVVNGVLWENLKQSHEAGHMLAAGSPSGSDTCISDLGIVFGHAYAILKVVDMGGNKLLQLRNPWGKTEWKGDWGDDSSQWTTRMKTKLNFTKADDGTFWMCFRDFTRHYQRVYKMLMFDRSKYQQISHKGRFSVAKKTAGGCFPNEKTARHNPMWNVTVTAPTKVAFVLCREDDRGKAELGISMGMKLYKNRGRPLKWSERLDKYPTFLQSITGFAKAEVVAKVNYNSRRSIYMEATLEPTERPYVLFMSTFEAGKEAMFMLETFHEGKKGCLKMEPCPLPPRVAKGEPY